MKECLISYGKITDKFKIIAQLTNILKQIRLGNIKEFRLDCYKQDISPIILTEIDNKFEAIDKKYGYKEIEFFVPSKNYPSHIDDGGISYFIALEEGNFIIEDVIYKITPFVLYSFDESKPHNTNFGAIMLK